jgi:hypothetical protein
MPLRDCFDCYTLFEKHKEAFDASANFGEFIEKAGLKHLDGYVGHWVEDVFQTFKAGKKTCRGLMFPNANKFTDLFSAAYFATDQNKIPGAVYLGGSGALHKHCGGIYGWSKTSPDIKSHYGAKWYSTRVVPREEIAEKLGKSYSLEAVKREDGILILHNPHGYVGSTWLALLDLSENIETLFDDTTREFIAMDRKAEMDAWSKGGEKIS